MVKKYYTELAKAAYLVCCLEIRWMDTDPPIDFKSKSRFIISAPNEEYLKQYDKLWESGEAELKDARKYFYKLQDMRRRAIELARSKKSTYRSIISCKKCNREIYYCTIDKEYFKDTTIIDKTCFTPRQKAYGYPRLGGELNCPACHKNLNFNDLQIKSYK